MFRKFLSPFCLKLDTRRGQYDNGPAWLTLSGPAQPGLMTSRPIPGLDSQLFFSWANSLTGTNWPVGPWPNHSMELLLPGPFEIYKFQVQTWPTGRPARGHAGLWLRHVFKESAEQQLGSICCCVLAKLLPYFRQPLLSLSSPFSRHCHRCWSRKDGKCYFPSIWMEIKS